MGSTASAMLLLCVLLASAASWTVPKPTEPMPRRGMPLQINKPISKPKKQLDHAFSSWRNQHDAPAWVEHEVNRVALSSQFNSWREDNEEAERIQRDINRMMHPDVPVRLVFQGATKAAVLPGSATTDVLKREAARCWPKLGQEEVNFYCKGAALPLGVALSESPLANSTDLEVTVMEVPWWKEARGHGGARYKSSFGMR